MRAAPQRPRTARQEAPTAPLTRVRSLPLPANLPGDFAASLVVFLVAVPLSLGIAIASGAPLISGIIAAAVGGIVAGTTGGSAVQVSGPTAGLTIIVFGLVQSYGWQVTCLITALAGVVQLGLGAFRAARAALAVSPAVIHGMLAGVGVTIALAQLHVVLGGDPQSSAVTNILELPQQLVNNHTAAVAVGVVTMATMFLWSRLPRLGGLRPSRIPAALMAVGGATVLAAVAGWDVERVALPESFSAAWSGPAFPGLEQVPGVTVGVFTVAMVASVESLLCAIAVDRLHDGRRVRLNRELLGQGAANIASGTLGGLPVAGVIVRGTTNVRAGGRTPLATVLHGVWVLLFVALFAHLVELIPMAALAGLLVFVGFQMVDVAHLRYLHRQREAPVYVATLVAVVAFGIGTGVMIGVALALALSLRRLTRLSILTEQVHDRWHVVVKGSLTFLGVPRVTQVLRTLPTGSHVDLDLHVDFMDHAAFESIHTWRLDHERTGGCVDIDEIHENWYERSSMQTPPAHKTSPRETAQRWTPWSMDDSGGTSPSDLLHSGVQEHHAAVTDRMRTLMAQLAQGQNPPFLFITCADSRVVPNLITGSGPGDLFTVRNIGNLVPRNDEEPTDHSVGAAIEYAVEVLGVSAIAVCGHSNCGAMKALLSEAGSEPDSERLEHLGPWLRGAAPSLERFAATSPAPANPAESLRLLAQNNVTQQLDNLLTYPGVRSRSERGELKLFGLYYDLETVRMHILDENRTEFVPIRFEGDGTPRQEHSPEQQDTSPA
ncbi:carbonic anhydrase [Haloactinospora alba]|uniref:carbonic anhydrase n=1 Tax=Haloactinospora alba TaxID=405555 RepID=A0A543NHW5_9ACTN|nr:SulP family inorganic anion transporter [Haloactinospora alba]TQN31438.1 carbonic anhydrase [Haloactinospora alba]